MNVAGAGLDEARSRGAPIEALAGAASTSSRRPAPSVLLGSRTWPSRPTSAGLGATASPDGDGALSENSSPRWRAPAADLVNRRRGVRMKRGSSALHPALLLVSGRLPDLAPAPAAGPRDDRAASRTGHHPARHGGLDAPAANLAACDVRVSSRHGPPGASEDPRLSDPSVLKPVTLDAAALKLRKGRRAGIGPGHALGPRPARPRLFTGHRGPTPPNLDLIRHGLHQAAVAGSWSTGPRGGRARSPDRQRVFSGRSGSPGSVIQGAVRGPAQRPAVPASVVAVARRQRGGVIGPCAFLPVPFPRTSSPPTVPPPEDAGLVPPTPSTATVARSSAFLRGNGEGRKGSGE